MLLRRCGLAASAVQTKTSLASGSETSFSADRSILIKVLFFDCFNGEGSSSLIALSLHRWRSDVGRRRALRSTLCSTAGFFGNASSTCGHSIQPQLFLFVRTRECKIRKITTATVRRDDAGRRRALSCVSPVRTSVCTHGNTMAVRMHLNLKVMLSSYSASWAVIALTTLSSRMLHLILFVRITFLEIHLWTG